MTPLHGWIILDKPLGLSSAGGVAAVKRILRQAGFPKVKIGHGGTLDPLATGVLPIALGEATKLAGRMLDSDKIYAFTVAFGTQTSTLDTEGEIVASAPLPTRDAVWAAMSRFRGEIDQAPPAYSAIKVDGKRAYALARAGETVDLPSRRVTIFDLYSTNRLGGTDCSGDELLAFAELRAAVSKGTYVRSLARDIAVAAGSVGHVTALRRLKAGPFTLQDAITLDNLASLVQGGALEQALMPLTAGLDDIPALAVDPDQAAALQQGRRLTGHPAAPGTYLACHGSVPVALVEVTSQEEVVVLRGFNLI